RRPGLAVVAAFVADEVEQLVFLNRAAERAAELVVDRFRLALPDGEEVGLGLDRVVAVIFEGRAVLVVRAALNLDVDGGAAGESEIGVETAGDDADSLDGFEAGDV